MGKLIKLPNAQIEGENPTPSAEIVEYLEGVLEKAKSGEMQAFALAWVSHEDLAAHRAFYIAGTDYRTSLIAGASLVWHELVVDSSVTASDDTAPPEDEPGDE